MNLSSSEVHRLQIYSCGVKLRVSADVRQVDEAVNLPRHMTVRHMPVQVELTKQRCLLFLLPTHRCMQSPKSMGNLNQPLTSRSSDFFNIIGGEGMFSMTFGEEYYFPNQISGYDGAD